MIKRFNNREITILLNIWKEASAIAHPFLTTEFIDRATEQMINAYLPNSDTWIYEEEGEVIGFISMFDSEIAGLFVLPNHHSKGVGTMLVQHVNQSQDGLEVEVFDKNIIGKPFYIKQGFKFMKEYIHKETGQKIIRMKKTS